MWSENMFEESRKDAMRLLGDGAHSDDIVSIGSIHNGEDARIGDPRLLIMGHIEGCIHLHHVTWDEILWLDSIEPMIAEGLGRDMDVNDRWRLRHNALRRRRKGMEQPDNAGMVRTLGWGDPAPWDCTLTRLREFDALSNATLGCARREGTRFTRLMPDPSTWHSLIWEHPLVKAANPRLKAVCAAADWMDGTHRGAAADPSPRIIEIQERTPSDRDGDADITLGWNVLDFPGDDMGTVRRDVAWLMAEARIRDVLGDLTPTMMHDDGGRAYVSAMRRMIDSCSDILYAPTPDGFLKENLLAAL